MDADISELKQSTGSLERSNQELFQKCADLEKQMDQFSKILEVAEKAPSQHTHNPNWDREPDGTIIKVTAKEPVPRDKVVKVLEELLGEYKDKATISGSNDTDSKFFIIKFTGPPGIAKQRVQKLLASQRQPDGTWKQYCVKTHDHGTGLADDARSKSVRLSISEDKSSKQIAMEVSGRKLRDILGDVFPHKTFYLSRADGNISSDWINIAEVVPLPDRTIRIDWQVKSPLYASIDTNDVAARFRLANGAAPVQEQWSI